MLLTTATRYHDFSAGHIVMGHEGKCANLHGHNYRVHFTVVALWGTPELDKVGRVLDFSVINTRLCQWVENTWDHKFLIHKDHPMAQKLVELDWVGVVPLPFNPTAELLANHLLQLGPILLGDTGAQLVRVVLEETRKCSATVELQP